MIIQMKNVLKRQPIWAIFLGMFLLSSLFVPGFFSSGNFLNILVQTAVDGMLALGMTYLMINGYFDLSVGTVMGLSAALTIGMQKYGLFPAIMSAALAGAAIGLVNGFFVAKVKINAFIVTLGSFIGVRGLVYIYTKEDALIGEIMELGIFGSDSFLGLPVLFVVMIVAMGIASFGLRMTPHGRYTYAVGGNMEAAENAGIPVDRTIMINFTICGLTAALGGILLAARLNAATPALGWPDKNLMIIATVVLGGTSLTGGSGSIVRTLGGLFTIGMLYNILNLMNVQSYYNTLIMGLVLIMVVYADSHIKKRNLKTA